MRQLLRAHQEHHPQLPRQPNLHPQGGSMTDPVIIIWELLLLKYTVFVSEIYFIPKIMKYHHFDRRLFVLFVPQD